VGRGCWVGVLGWGGAGAGVGVVRVTAPVVDSTRYEKTRNKKTHAESSVGDAAVNIPHLVGGGFRSDGASLCRRGHQRDASARKYYSWGPTRDLPYETETTHPLTRRRLGGC